MLANTVAFAIGFGVFLVAFFVLAVFVVRYAGRVGKRRAGQAIDPRSDGVTDAERPADDERRS